MRNLLFTPGPLTTSETVRLAMQRDYGSRDREFIRVVRDVRQKLLTIASAADGEYEAILMQGSGTFGIEAVVSSVIPPNGKLLVAINGAYGRRMADIASRLGIPVVRVEGPEHLPLDPAAIHRVIEQQSGVTHIGTIHCETTTGVLNPVDAIGSIAARHRASLIVDAMSSFGAIALDLRAANAAYLISSSNKSLEGVPGLSFILARRADLLGSEGYARTVSLDLHAQWRGFEKDGQFRFTPPTHVLLALSQAIDEFEAEGGIAGRALRYAANREVLREGMRGLGFREYLAPEHQSDVIMTYRYPDLRPFHFGSFYSALSEQGFTIYPGKVSGADCFRVGLIGQLFPPDFTALIDAMSRVLAGMGFERGRLMRDPLA